MNEEEAKEPKLLIKKILVMRMYGDEKEGPEGGWKAWESRAEAYLRSN